MKVAKGFTLLELLLAMAIFALISLAGFTIFNTVLESEKGARARIERLNSLQTAFLVMERDFTQLARRHVRVIDDSSSKNFIYSQEDSFSVNTESLGFVRQGWSNPGLVLPRSDVQAVAYHLNENTLERLHYNFVDPVLGEEAKVRPLINEVVSLSFEFFYNQKWQKTLISGRLPAAVAIELTTEDLGDIRRQFLLPSTGTP